MIGTHPFFHMVQDDYFPREDVSAALSAWPHMAPGWVTYDTPQQRKRTLHDWGVFPAAIRSLLGRMLLLPVADWLGLSGSVVPDATLWGAGLCVMRQGDELALHLDHHTHPRLGLERRANAILFLTSQVYEEEGGELELWPADLSSPVRIRPLAGRLVVWRAGDTSYHSVRRLSGWPAGALRATLSVYFYGPPTGEPRRPQALFLPSPAA